MTLRNERAFCRICLGHSGMKLAIVYIRGDKDNPTRRGNDVDQTLGG